MDTVLVEVVTSLPDISLLRKEKGMDWPFNVASAKVCQWAAAHSGNTLFSTRLLSCVTP